MFEGRKRFFSEAQRIDSEMFGSDSLFRIEEGSIKACTLRGDFERTLCIFKEGDLIHNKMTKDIDIFYISLTDSAVVKIETPPENFDATGLIDQAVKQIGQYSSHISALQARGNYQKFLHLLLNLADKFELGAPSRKDIFYEMPKYMNQKELAQLLSMRRESISLYFKKAREDQLLKSSGRRYFINIDAIKMELEKQSESSPA
jgi:CRP-like cAMP-binding protein